MVIYRGIWNIVAKLGRGKLTKNLLAKGGCLDRVEIVTNTNMPSEHVKNRIEKFKKECAKAAEKGYEILPHIDGPYVFDPRAQTVIGRYKTEEYKKATS